jgi:hypothetical protein
MQTFSGNGEKTQEPMIGELTGKDNKTLVLSTPRVSQRPAHQQQHAVVLLHPGRRQDRVERGELHRDQAHALTRAAGALSVAT